jgi:hypothetical protein
MTISNKYNSDNFIVLHFWVGSFCSAVNNNNKAAFPRVSQLMYGIGDNPSDSESIVYGPYNTLMPNSEGSSKQYPISFHNTRIESGCICYDIKSGSCKSGMKYLFQE